MHLISKEQELIIFIIVTIIMWLSCLSMHNVPDHVYATWFAIKQSYTAHTLTKVLHWRQYNIKTDNGKFILMHSFFHCAGDWIEGLMQAKYSTTKCHPQPQLFRFMKEQFLNRKEIWITNVLPLIALCTDFSDNKPALWG